MTDKLRELTLLALESHGCERLKDFYECGPVQRAAVETFLEAALAQQDAQAVRQDWKLVPVEALSDHIADLRRCASMFRRRGMTATADETIKAADELEAMLNAAPTPPASRAVLTDEEVLDLWSPGLRRPALGVEKVKAFARAVIEAYERKNGIK